MTKRQKSRENMAVIILIFSTISLCAYTGYLLYKFDTMVDRAKRVMDRDEARGFDKS